MKFDVFRKPLEEIHVSLKCDKNKTNIVQKIKTHILCSVTFFFENRAVYEAMWKNVVERGRPQMTIWRLHIACWILEAKYTRSECVILMVFP